MHTHKMNESAHRVDGASAKLPTANRSEKESDVAPEVTEKRHVTHTEPSASGRCSDSEPSVGEMRRATAPVGHTQASRHAASGGDGRPTLGGCRVTQPVTSEPHKGDNAGRGRASSERAAVALSLLPETVIPSDPAGSLHF